MAAQRLAVVAPTPMSSPGMAGRDLGCQLGAGGVAHGCGADSQGAQPAGEDERPDRVAGVAAGEQPGASDLVGHAVGVPGWELGDQGGEWFVDGHGGAAGDGQHGAVAAVVDIVAGEPGDAGERLALEDEEGGGYPVGGGGSCRW